MRISLIAFFGGQIVAKPLSLGIANLDTSFTAFQNLSKKIEQPQDSTQSENINADIVYFEPEDYLDPEDYEQSSYEDFSEFDFTTTIGLSTETVPTEVFDLTLRVGRGPILDFSTSSLKIYFYEFYFFGKKKHCRKILTLPENWSKLS